MIKLVKIWEDRNVTQNSKMSLYFSLLITPPKPRPIAYRDLAKV